MRWLKNNIKKTLQRDFQNLGLKIRVAQNTTQNILVSTENHTSYEEHGKSQNEWENIINRYQHLDDPSVKIIWQEF